MTVQIDPDHRPIQARRDLLNMCRLPRAVIALDHDPAIMFEPGQKRDRRLRVKSLGFIDGRNIFRPFLKSPHNHIRVEAKHLANVDRLGWLHA